MMFRRLLFGSAVAWLAACAAPADEIVLAAIDSDAIDTIDDRNWGWEPEYVWVPAYWQAGIDHRDGFIKFDLSAIPDGSEILEMTLTTYHAERPFDPYNDPQVKIYRVADDTWSNAAPNDPHPGLNEALTPIHSGFPSGDLVAWDWPLDVGAVNWSEDLQDDRLSLAMRTLREGEWNYVHWYDFQQGAHAPSLAITFYECHGDLDGDGDVDLADLAQLLAHYGTTSGAVYEDGDLDGDGDVDLADLAILLSRYGEVCP